jgi:hypothetical protein
MLKIDHVGTRRTNFQLQAMRSRPCEITALDLHALE